jgi:hypothetical protein
METDIHEQSQRLREHGRRLRAESDALIAHLHELLALTPRRSRRISREGTVVDPRDGITYRLAYGFAHQLMKARYTRTGR